MGLCLLAAWAIQSQNKPISYACRATAIPRVLSELSKVTGLTLKAVGEAKSEIVLVQVNQIPPAKLLKKIAEATSCSWDTTKDGYTLKPNSKAREREEQQELADQAGKIRESIRAKLKEADKDEAEEIAGLANPSPPKEDDSEYFRLTTGQWTFEHPTYDPSDTVALRLLNTLEPEMLATLPMSRRLVWASAKPTEFQGMLPQSAEPVLADYQADMSRLANQRHQEYVRFIASGQKLDPNPDEDATEMKEVRDQDTADSRADVPIMKTLLIVHKDAQGIYARVRCFDSRGTTIYKEDATRAESTAATWEDPDLDPPKRDLSGLALEPDSSEVVSALLKGNVMVNNLRFLAPDLRKKFADLAEHDPLSYPASDLVLFLKPKSSSQIVADLPDSFGLATLNALGVSDPFHNGAFQSEEPDPADCLKISTEGDFTLVRPARPAENRESRLNRAEFGALLSKTGNNGCPTMWELCEFARANPAYSMKSLGSLYQALYWPSLEHLREPALDWPFMRIFSQLSQAQLALLRSGNPLPMADLGPEARQILAQASVSIDYLGMPLLRDVAANDNEDDYDEHLLASEVTEFLPSALRTGYLTLYIQTSSTAFSSSDKDNSFRAAKGGSEFGMDQARPGPETPEPLQARLGKLTTCAVECHLRKDLEVSGVLHDYSMPNDSPLLLLDQFPPDFLAAAKEMREIAEKVHRERPLAKGVASPN